jgi:transketolase
MRARIAHKKTFPPRDPAAAKLKTSAMIASIAGADQRTQAAPFGHALANIAERDPRIVGMTADLAKYTDLHVFAQAHPDRFYQMGMAEQLLMGAAAGMAREGFVPFATTYAVFASRRAYDFICMAIAEESLPVKIVCALPGLTTGYGPSHQATEDLAIFRGLPNMTVIDPCDARDIEQATAAVAAHDGPVYMRLLRGAVPLVLDEYDYTFELGKAKMLREGNDVLFVSSGLMTMRTLEAAKALEADRVSAAVLHVPTIKPLDEAAILAAAGKPGDARIFAVRALGRAGKDAAADLSAIVSSTDAGPAERAEAARTLGTLGEPGHAAAAELLGKLVPDKDPFAIAALGGSSYAVLATLLGALGDAAPKRAEPALNALANLEAPGEPPPPLARRIQDLRCLAAGHLARGAFDAEILKKCAPVGSYAAERARLAALVRQPLAGARKAEWRRLTKSEHVRVREAALEAADGHHELGAEARAAIAEALASDKAGLVATAADALNAHPERVLVLAESEKRAALDPKAPPPGPDPARELDRDVAKALRVALERKWAPDLFETRLALLDASVAVAHPAARAQALALCKDPNVTVRERAHKALRSLGDTQSTCHAPDDAGPAAEEVGKPSKPAKIVLSTDSGALTVKLAPELAPVTAARLASLAKAGFYKGIVVHRVVPGFVVQLGDPQGDGYGGSGTPLRCETSPSAFAPLDVGMALAGRDTGSSQFFVTLARTAHLDGEYTKVGHAEGDWASVVEGDVVRDVRVEE